MNNFSIICKKFYIETMLDELGIPDPTRVNCSPHLAESAKTYIRVKEKNVDTIVKDHMAYLSENFPLLQLMQGIPFLMWTAKMHKTPPSQRFIAISSRCTTKPLSVLITLGLNRVLGQWRTHANFVKKDHGISPMWVIDNSNDIHKRITLINNTFKANDADTFDFFTLFTGIEHTDLKSVIEEMVKKSFSWCKRKYLTFYDTRAKWTKNKSKTRLSMDCDTFIKAITWLIDNIFVTFGGFILRQIIGVPMGTNCAPLLANLYLAWYEFNWFKNNADAGNYALLHHFKSCYRYIDDLLSLNNNTFFNQYKHKIYPSSLMLRKENTDSDKVHFLDLNIFVRDSLFITNIYDKREDYAFKIINFPNLKGNIPYCDSYSTFTTELVRYAKGCTMFKDFKERTMNLVKKLIKDSFFNNKLLSKTFSKFCRNHVFIILKFGSQVLSLYKVIRKQ